MKFFTVAELGPKRHVTPEGFLVCEDAVLARTGQQSYHKRENPEFQDAMFPDHFTVDRDAEDLFSPETLASVQGKPVVNDHPRGNGWVNSKNYHQYAIGHVLNPRQGTGDQADLMIGDLLITNADAVIDVMHGKKELSLGYDAQYVPTGDGMFKQTNFVGNHVALVDKGRCGPRCCIGDAACSCEGCKMKKNRNPHSLIARLKNALKTGDSAEEQAAEEALMENLDAAPGGADDDQHIHVHLPDEGGAPPLGDGDDDNNGEPPWFKTFRDSMEGRLGALEAGRQTGDDDAEKEDAALEGELEVEAPRGVTGDRARKATDSAYLAESFQETASLAEAIAPGISLPKFDRTAKPRATFDSIQEVRSKALELAYASPEKRGLIEQVLGNRQFEPRKMTHDGLRTAFRAVGSFAKKSNNARASNQALADNDRGGMIRMPASLADINKLNRERREKRSH